MLTLQLSAPAVPNIAAGEGAHSAAPGDDGAAAAAAANAAEPAGAAAEPLGTFAQQPQQPEGLYFQVVLPPPSSGHAEFLILQSRFVDAVKHTWQVGDRVQVSGEASHTLPPTTTINQQPRLALLIACMHGTALVLSACSTVCCCPGEAPIHVHDPYSRCC